MKAKYEQKGSFYAPLYLIPAENAKAVDYNSFD